MAAFPLDRIGAGLPVAAVLERLEAAVAGAGRAVVQAPPGTGKTTLVPPLLANHVAGRVIVTQPRRVAARAAAARLAALAGVRLGGEVGYRVRGDARASAATRVEFCTTGILLRRLLAEPDLPGVSAVVLDEVHERQLDSDLVLGMMREVADLRGDLALVAMSATLDADRFAALLGADTTVVEVPGVLHELAVAWAPPPPGVTPLGPRGVTDDFLAHVAATTRRALAEHAGDALVFLPGVREVERVVDLLAGAEVAALPLHGRLSATEQDRALRGPEEDGAARRVVVATAVAESSLTVPGVRLVVDSGLAREPRYDAGRGMTGLVTRTESRSSAEQRAGRAARKAPGVVVRCFPASTWARLDAAPTPEILTADLTRAVLDLACWGTPRGEGLALLDPLPAAAAARAEATLRELGAVDGDGRATDEGRRLARIPADPRVARALFVGAAAIGTGPAAEIVAALETDARAPGADVAALLRGLRSGRISGAAAWRSEADRLARAVATEASPRSRGNVEGAGRSRGNASADIGMVIAAAFPDRIARRRAPGSRAYLLSGGTGADLPRDSALGEPEWLAIAQVDRTATGAVIRAAAPLSEEQALAAGDHLATEREEVAWSAGRLTAARVRRLGAIELTRTPNRPTAAAGAAAVRETLARDGLGLLGWPEPASALRRRLAFLRERLGDPWPDVSDAALLARIDEWLGPELIRLAEGAPVRSLDLSAALRRLLPWPAAGEFDALAPERLEVPTGSRIRLDYPEDPTDRPVLAVKLQECFGLTETPRVAGVPVLFHLLSPAGRPLAVTDDLASFWVNAYPGCARRTGAATRNTPGRRIRSPRRRAAGRRGPGVSGRVGPRTDPLPALG